MNLYLIGSGYRDVTVAKEGAVGIVAYKAGVVGKGVIDADTSVLDTQVATMHATFRAIHATALGTVAIVQDFSRQASQGSTFVGFKAEEWYT